MARTFLRCIAGSALLLLAQPFAAGLRAESGYDLWLRYAPVEAAERAGYRDAITAIVVPMRSPTGDAIAAELERGLKGLLAVDVPRIDRPRAGTVVVATGTSPLVAGPGWTAALERLGPEGYVIRSTSLAGTPATVVASSGEAGALYGAFHLLRLIQMRRPLSSLDIAERPRLQRCLLNHWDNLDGSIERGYAARPRWSPRSSR